MKKNKNASKTTLDSVPDELLIEILSRLPTNTLLHIRSVSKSWYSLIATKSLITAHLHRTNISQNTPRKLVISYKHDKHQYLSFINDHDNSIVDEDDDELLSLNINPLTIRVVGSCNGLLCLSDYNGADRVIVLNPSINRLALDIGLTRSTESGFHRYVFGFGFDSKKSKDYKVVKIVYIYDFKNGDGVPGRVEVCTLGRPCWRSIDVGDFWCEIGKCCSVFVNGAVHWVGVVRSGILTVVGFDLGDEVFREIQLPKYLANRCCFSTTVYVKGLGELLALIHYEQESITENFHVWVMEKYGVTESWTKRYIITGQKMFGRVLGFRKNGDVLMVRREEGELISCDLKKRRVNHLGIYGCPHSFYVDTYVESLVGLELDGAIGVIEANPNSVANKEESGRKKKSKEEEAS